MKRKVLFIFTMLWRMFKLSVLRVPVKIRFHELRGLWYVDFPEYPGPHENLQMVAGADKLCMSLAQPHKEVEVMIGLKPPTNITGKYRILELKEDGETYGRNYNLYTDYIVPRSEAPLYKWELWLCPVMRYTFGHYPKNIYITKIEEYKLDTPIYE